MAEIPGLDVLCAPTSGHGTDNVFGEFFPISKRTGNMRIEDDFICEKKWTLKAPVTLVMACDKKDSNKVSLLIPNSAWDEDKKKRRKKDDWDEDEDLVDIFYQVGIMRRLDHKNVLKFYEPISRKKLTQVAFVLEPHGDLMSNLIAENIQDLYKPPIIKTIMRDLFTALSYLHQNRIIHMDINPENILFSSTGVLKVWNFRNAQKIGYKPKESRANEFRYQPLELLLQAGKYDETVDTWSAICLFGQLWMKKCLFPEHGREIVIAGVLKLLGFPSRQVWEEFYSFPGALTLDSAFSKVKNRSMLDLHFRKNCDQIVPPSAMDLMHRCFYFNPKDRPKAQRCLRHPYFHEDPKESQVEDIAAILKQSSINRELRSMEIKEEPH